MSVMLLSVIFPTDVLFGLCPLLGVKKMVWSIHKAVLCHCLSMKSPVWAPDSVGERGNITGFIPGGRRGIWPDLPRGCGEHGGLG